MCPSTSITADNWMRPCAGPAVRQRPEAVPRLDPGPLARVLHALVRWQAWRLEQRMKRFERIAAVHLS